MKKHIYIYTLIILTSGLMLTGCMESKAPLIERGRLVQYEETKGGLGISNNTAVSQNNNTDSELESPRVWLYSNKLSAEFHEYIENLRNMSSIVSERYSTASKKSVINNYLDFIRHRHYNDEEWKRLAGSLNKNLEEELNDYRGMQTVLQLNITEFYSVDILHLMAALDMGLNNHMFLGSLGGDIVEAASADDGVGTKGGVFNIRDLEADVDAINIHHIIEVEKYDLPDALLLYYSLMAESKNPDTYRYYYYKNNISEFEDITKEYRKEPLLKLLEAKLNVKHEDYLKKEDELILKLKELCCVE